MHIRKRAAAMAVAAAAAAATTLVAAGPLAAQADAQQRAAAGPVPVITVHISKSTIHLSTGNSFHAGRVIFQVKTKKGDHTLQIVKVNSGYSVQQAGQDFPKAFNGDTAAIKRLDNGLTFRGGVEVRPHSPGWFSTTLTANTYYFFDQNGNAFDKVVVHGKPPVRQTIPHRGSYTAFTYGWGTSSRLPASGTVRFRNHADQPHLLVIQHVKDSTTNRTVQKFIKSGNQGKPSWIISPETSAGVVSPGKGQLMRYDLPAGKYLIACFWPDLFTGQPHFEMGMWKLVHLR